MSVKFFHTNFASKDDMVRARVKHTQIFLMALEIHKKIKDDTVNAKAFGMSKDGKSGKTTWQDKLAVARGQIRSSRLRSAKRGRSLFR